MDLKRLEKMNSLFDFYGLLLTPRQQKLMQLYYKEDFSLGEIAAEHEISRQAVHDTLKRAEKTLGKFEDKLGLLGKYCDQKEKTVQALNKLTACKSILGNCYTEGNNKEAALETEKLLNEIAQILEGILDLNFS